MLTWFSNGCCLGCTIASQRVKGTFILSGMKLDLGKAGRIDADEVFEAETTPVEEVTTSDVDVTTADDDVEVALAWETDSADCDEIAAVSEVITEETFSFSANDKTSQEKKVKYVNENKE